MKKGRLLPNWVRNLVLISLFLLLNVVFSCKTIALGYRISKFSSTLQNLKSWNEYYKSRVLKEFSPESIRKKVEKMNLALSVPEDWRVRKVVIDRNVPQLNNGKVEAATR